MLRPWVFFLLGFWLPLVVSIYEDTDVVQETLKDMLDFDHMPDDVKPLPMMIPSKTASRYMEDLYRTFVDEDGSDDGNIVRSIEPSVGKIDGQEVLIFDISNLGEEKIMRGELHFHLRRRGIPSRRIRSLTARSLCTNDYCTEGQFLQQIGRHDDGILFDATKSLVESHALGAKQLIFRISRKDVKMRSYSEMVRKSAPFLLVFSRADNTIDAENVKKEAEKTKRKRREAGYYEYKVDGKEPIQRSTPTPELEALRQKADEIANKLPHKKLRAHRKKGKKEEDIWNGFGEEEGTEELKTTTMKTELSNNVRVVLLGEGRDRQICKRHSFVVDFFELGWHEFILAPAFFEAGHCAGTCPNPLPRSTNPSNHAVLQSLLLPNGGNACCAPDETRSLTILYKDERGRVTIKNFPRMIVESCACI